MDGLRIKMLIKFFYFCSIFIIKPLLILLLFTSTSLADSIILDCKGEGGIKASSKGGSPRQVEQLVASNIILKIKDKKCVVDWNYNKDTFPLTQVTNESFVCGIDTTTKNSDGTNKSMVTWSLRINRINGKFTSFYNKLHYKTKPHQEDVTIEERFICKKATKLF